LKLTNFTEADLSGADLSRAELRGAKFDRAVMNRTLLRQADLRPEIVRIANAEPITYRTTFLACPMAGADFTGAKAEDVLTEKFDAVGVIADPDFFTQIAPRR
jgi:uncharacterized protein YjbI with pentapeptide repeats